MAEASKNEPKVDPEAEQLGLDFPNPEDFPSYDEVESEEGQAQLPDDSFDESAVNDDEGCGCV